MTQETLVGSKADTLSPVVAYELDSIATVLNSKFPATSPTQVRDVVYETYRRLASTATIQAHLIPLTVNAARKRLALVRADPDPAVQ